MPPGGFSPQPFPGYRPFEQSLGYVPPSRSTGPGLGGAGGANGYAGQPRLNVPPRPGYNSSYAGGQDYSGFQNQPAGADPRFSNPRSGRPAYPPGRPAVPQYEDGPPDDGYYPEQMPLPRSGRRSAADYQQAYRDMEQGYDEEPPRSRGPWILLGLLLMTLGIAMAGVWYYQTAIKPTMTSAGSNQQVPVVQPPAGEAVAQPEQPGTADPSAAAGGKKRIYDRILGDQETLGGQLAPAEEVPIAPATQETQIPEPNIEPAAGAPAGEDASPLPIPPPPGDGDTQGSLTPDPASKAASLTESAAGDSQAAVAAQDEASVPPPAPGETTQPEPVVAGQGSETIEPVDESQAEPVVPAKTAKKAVAEKEEIQDLGSEPVVLVPPASGPAIAAGQTQVAGVESAAVTDDLYGGDGEIVSSTAPLVPVPAVKKKKKTLADLLGGSAGGTAEFAPESAAPAPAAKPAPAPALEKPAAVAPAPDETQVALASGYVAQLASFRSRQEADTEYGRLKSKYGGILQGTSPIVSEATIAGSTRYRLAVGKFASKGEASAICSRLIAAGERDCLVKTQ